MNGDARVPSPASATTQKRRNAVLHLYDSPLTRDWAFWMTIGWGALAAASISTSKNHHGLPAWLDTLLATIFFMAFFGLFPAAIRLAIRRRREQKSHQALASPGPSRLGPAPWDPPSPASDSPLRPPVSMRPTPEVKAPPLNSRSSTPFPRDPSSTQHRTEPRPPSTVSLVRNDAVAPTPVLTHAESSLPYPIARATRAFLLAPTPRDQYEALLDAAEVVAIVMSATSAALLRGNCIEGRGDRGEEQSALAALQRSYLTYSGTAFGAWTTWLGSIRPLVAHQPDLVPGLLTALDGDPGSQGALAHLNALREERNRSAHGNKPKGRQEAALRVAQHRPHLEAALAASSFLEDLPWIFIRSCEYMQRTEDFSISAGYAMGDHPDFERRTYMWTRPVASEFFYVLGPTGPVGIFPYVESLFCPQCEQSEVCYTYKVGKKDGPAHLKSFSRGHEISDDEIGDEVRSLLDFQI